MVLEENRWPCWWLLPIFWNISVGQSMYPAPKRGPVLFFEGWVFEPWSVHPFCPFFSFVFRWDYSDHDLITYCRLFYGGDLDLISEEGGLGLGQYCGIRPVGTGSKVT